MKHDWKNNSCTCCKLFRFISTDSYERLAGESEPITPKLEMTSRYFYIPNSIDFSVVEQEGECLGHQEKAYRLESTVFNDGSEILELKQPNFLNSETMWGQGRKKE